MRKVIFYLLLFNIITISCCGSDNELKIAWNSYSNDYFAFKYPEKWPAYSNETENSHEIALVRFDIKENYLFGVVISKDTEYSSIDNKEVFYTYIENKLLPGYKNIIINDSRRITIDSLPAYRLVYLLNGPDGEENLQVICSFVYYNPGQILILICQTPEDEFNEELFNEIIDSLEFYN